MSDALGWWDGTLAWWANHGLAGWSRRSALRKFSRRNNGVERVVHTRHGFAMDVRIGDPVDTALAVSGTFEPALCGVVSSFLKPGMTFVDVGCNIGFISCLVAAGSPGCRILAIDANPEMVRRCRGNLQRNHFDAEVVNLGVGAVPGDLEFFVTPDRPSMGSFGAGEGMRARIDSGQAQAFTVPVRPLPDILRAHGIAQVDLLKVDIEGFEPALFAGIASEPAAAPIAALVFEYSPEHSRRCGFALAELWRLPWWSRYRTEAMCLERGLRTACTPDRVPDWTDTVVATLK